MQKEIKLGNTKWIYVQSCDKEAIKNLAQEYNFHEMVLNDLNEIHSQSKIEINDKFLFLALSFAKYIKEKSRYFFNELDVVVGEDYIITSIGIESESLNNLFDEMKKESEKIDFSYKTSPYYILYRIIDGFYKKTIVSLNFSSQKLLNIQNDISEQNLDKEIIDDLVNEDLNKILIKNNFISQQDVIDDLNQYIKNLHQKHFNIYFNDLKVKLGRIVNIINVLTEKNDSLMNAYNTFISIKNNNSVTRLTFINAIFLPLTVLVGIGGMSEWTMITGSQNRKITYPLFILLCVVLAYVTYYLLNKIFVRK